jgi:hypothetical protein
MGEAKRRAERGLEIKGPFSYEVGYYSLDDIFNGVLATMLGVARPSEQAYKIIRATEDLARRMQDRCLQTMLCMTCDHVFTHNERPVEVAVAFSWANREHPPIVSPICGACAAQDEATKTARAAAHWRKLFPGTQAFPAPGIA